MGRPSLQWQDIRFRERTFWNHRNRLTNIFKFFQCLHNFNFLIYLLKYDSIVGIFYSKNCIPEQGCVLQKNWMIFLPLQPNPPSEGGGSLQVRFFPRSPTPHGFVHENSAHATHPPSTKTLGKRNFKWKFCPCPHPPSTKTLGKRNFKWKFPPCPHPPSTKTLGKRNFKLIQKMVSFLAFLPRSIKRRSRSRVF